MGDRLTSKQWWIWENFPGVLGLQAVLKIFSKYQFFAVSSKPRKKPTYCILAFLFPIHEHIFQKRGNFSQKWSIHNVRLCKTVVWWSRRRRFWKFCAEMWKLQRFTFFFLITAKKNPGSAEVQVGVPSNIEFPQEVAPPWQTRPC